MSYSEELPDRPVGRSGAVTAVGVVNFVLGGLLLVCGLLTMAGGAFMQSGFFQQALQQQKQQMQQQGKQMDPNQAKAMEELEKNPGKISKAAMGAAVAMLSIAVGLIAAGVGVVTRKSWGRILSRVIAGLWLALGVVQLLMPDRGFCNLVMAVGYAALVFSILLNRRFATEFA